MKTETPRTNAFAKEVGRILAKEWPLRNTAGALQRIIDERFSPLEIELNTARAALEEIADLLPRGSSVAGKMQLIAENALAAMPNEKS